MILDRDKWIRVRELFEQAARRDPGERPRFLDRACASEDPTVRREVEQLLASLETVGDRVEEAVAGTATEAIERASGAPRAGGTLGVYRLIEILGTGGMATVYLAERADDAFHLKVAIKVVHGGFGRPRLVERFREERRILASLDHPNIARVLDGGTTDEGLPYLVMEHVAGRPIDAYCEARRLDVRDRLQLFRAVCSAVDHAHHRLVVHRDLKPANVLVTDEGIPKLLDFGIAKLLEQDPDAPALTGADARPMTPQYASPEQIRGGPVGTASDVHALGILLYELLTGTHPFAHAGPSYRDLEDTILETEPAAPGTLDPELPRDLDNIVLRALEKDPDRRYASAADFSADIGRHLTGHPVLARPSPFTDRALKYVRRNAVWVAVAAAFLVTLVGAAAVSISAYLRADRSRIEAETQRDALQEVNRFMSGIFEAASAEQRQSKDEVSAREILDAAAERIDRDLAGRPEIAATIRNEIGRRYFEIGLLEPSEALHRRAVQDWRDLDKIGSPEGIEALVFLGQALRARGEPEEAVAVLEEAVALATRKGEAPDALVWDAKRSLAHALKTNGEYEASRSILGPLLDELRGVEGEVLEIRSSVANDLGIVLSRMGRYAEAEELLREAIDEGVKAFGERHTMVGERWSNLAVVLNAQDRREEAVVCSRKALEINRAVLGDDHPSVAATRLGLADGLVGIGRAAEAEPLHDQVLEVFRAAYGEDHPQVGVVLANRAMGLMKQGEYDRAREGMRAARKIYEQTFGPDHHVTAIIVHNLARVDYEAGVLDRAERICREALALRERILAAEHPDIVRSLVLLGDILRARGRADEAISPLEEAVRRARTHLPRTDGVRRSAERGLALCLLEKDRFERAETLLLGVYAVVDSLHGSDHDRTRSAAADLAAFYERWGRPEAAARYRALSGAPGTARNPTH
ncbi:MAG: tetratricopeptide repeat protein [Candidatus Eisenbacteria bacterium]|nr:tetratricopeptide repeat protein [Candidatus Latescibacterota bacterium]MBD3302176.1 tetratricopeptide repeat protein [Candidatus Eisenbacteria bacterium]